MKTSHTIILTSCVLAGALGVCYLYWREQCKERSGSILHPEVSGMNKPGAMTVLHSQTTKMEDTSMDIPTIAPSLKAKKVIPITTTKVVSLPKKPVSNTDAFPLALGSKGEKVERLQKWLLRYHGYKGTINGIFDKELLDGVRQYLGRTTITELFYREKRMGLSVFEQENNRYYG